MKRIITLSFLSALLVVGISAGAFAGAKMQLSSGEFTFGFVPQHAKVSHVFWVKSIGSDTLRIEKVIPGCGCTQAPLEKDVLAPGDSTRLEVVFATRNYTGLVTKAPKILTNASEHADIVKFYAMVIPKPDTTNPVVIMPYKLDLSKTIRRVGDRVEFAIKNVSDQAVSLKLIDQPEGYWELSLPSQIGAGESAQAVLTALEPGTAPRYEKSFTIELNDAAKSRFTVPVLR